MPEKRTASPSNNPAARKNRLGIQSLDASAAPPLDGVLSQCCGEPVKVVGDREGTQHYEYTQCGEACDAR
jgi:hypothetical protein